MPMQRFMIERNIPGAGQMTTAQLREAAQRSNAVLSALAPDIRWDHSYVAGDKIYCVYDAVDAAIIRKHAELSGIPADVIVPLARVIDPSTADAANAA